jgi:branched-chain amino acid transport system ATP-binding protein
MTPLAGDGSPPPVLETLELEASYGSIRALHGISVTVRAGEIVVILGANGAGKSTALRAIAGVGAKTTGRVLLNGVDISKWAPDRRVRGGIALVPEGRRLFPSLSVADHLRVGGVGCQDRHARAKWAAEVEELFPILRDRRSELAGNLSGGQQQQVAIARALMSDPRLLLLDEPSLGLSPGMVERVFDSITALRERGTTMLLVEQNVTDALAIADRAYVLTNGRVTQQGAVSEFGAVDELVGNYFGMDT